MDIQKTIAQAEEQVVMWKLVAEALKGAKLLGTSNSTVLKTPKVAAPVRKAAPPRRPATAPRCSPRDSP